MSLGRWIGFFAFVASMYILWQIRQIILLIFAAVVFSVALNRLVRWLERQGAKRGLALGISVFTLVSTLALIFALILPAFIDQLQQLTILVPAILERITVWVDWLQGLVPRQVLDIRNFGNLIPRIQPFITQIFGNFYVWFSDFVAILINLFLIVILTIMLAADPQPYRRGLLLLFPSFYRRRADEILSKCESRLVSWLTASLIDMAAIAVVSFIGLLLLGVPLAFANALLAGLLEFIPNIGPTLSVIPPMAVALLDEPWKAGAVLILYVIIQQFESFLLVPFIMNKQVELLPVVTLLSVIIFGLFFGFLGVFLAVPLVIVFKIWIEEVLVKDILNNWHEPPHRFYQPVIQNVEISKETVSDGENEGSDI